MTDITISRDNRGRPRRIAVRSSEWTKARRKVFLDTLATTCNVRMAAAAAGINEHNAYDLRRRDPGFAALWAEALALGYENLETALLHHALAGINAIRIEPGEVVLQRPSADAAGADVDAGPPAQGHRKPGSGIVGARRATPLHCDIELALQLLARRRRAIDGTAPAKPRRDLKRQATDAEVDAALTRKLDALARTMKRDA